MPLFLPPILRLLVLSSLFHGLAGAETNPKFMIRTVSQCADVHLHAAYLAEEKPGGGPGFYLQIVNDRSTEIAVPESPPLSVHWYAQTGGRWLWRASSGSGGSLANALREKGPLFADPGAPPGSASTAAAPLRSIAGHSSYSWTVFAGANPVLRYRPGCEHCTYRGEEQFHAVVAYAYQPSVKIKGGADGVDSSDPPTARLLNCGLRSNPVVMPPLPASSDPHNSTAR